MPIDAGNLLPSSKRSNHYPPALGKPKTKILFLPHPSMVDNWIDLSSTFILEKQFTKRSLTILYFNRVLRLLKIRFVFSLKILFSRNFKTLST